MTQKNKSISQMNSSTCLSLCFPHSLPHFLPIDIVPYTNLWEEHRGSHYVCDGVTVGATLETPKHLPATKTPGLAAAPAVRMQEGKLTDFFSICFKSWQICRKWAPKPRWPDCTQYMMFIHMHWNRLNVHVQNCCNQEMSHEMRKGWHINNLVYSLN